MTSPTPLIMDVDTGVDDAMSILLATRSPEFDLLGISCVAGNVNVDQVVDNTLRVLHTAGRDDVPVARGAERPLIEPHRGAGHVHGANGLADLALDPPPRQASDLHAVEMLRQLILSAATPPTIVAQAPLTDIALLLRTYPEVAPHIGRLVFMGGTVSAAGNATPVAEFNIWHDPEAAAILLQSDIPLTMYGLDVFYPVELNRTQATTLAESANPWAQLTGQLLLTQLNRGGIEHTTLGDAGVVASLLAPQAMTTRLLPVEINLAEGPGRGQTIVDRRDTPHGEQQGSRTGSGRLVNVCLNVDAAALQQVFLDRMLDQ